MLFCCLVWILIAASCLISQRNNDSAGMWHRIPVIGVRVACGTGCVTMVLCACLYGILGRMASRARWAPCLPECKASCELPGDVSRGIRRWNTNTQVGSGLSALQPELEQQVRSVCLYMMSSNMTSNIVAGEEIKLRHVHHISQRPWKILERRSSRRSCFTEAAQAANCRPPLCTMKPASRYGPRFSTFPTTTSHLRR